MRRRPGLPGLIAAGLGTAMALAQTARPPAEPQDLPRYIALLEAEDRDAWQKPTEVIRALALQPGMVVADIGAGTGYFSRPLARAVGPEGRVLALDVEPGLLADLTYRARRAGITNIVTRAVPPDDPKLAPASVDLVFLCNTWNLLPDPSAYLARLKPGLRPGGRLALINFHPRRTPHGPHPDHRISRDDVVSQVTAGGFTLAAEHAFLPEQHFLVFTVTE